MTEELKVYYEFQPTGDDAGDFILRTLYEKYKFQIMWSLRAMEEEMIIEGGIIVISKEENQHTIRICGFSQALSDKIIYRISQSNIRQ